jgi:membrane-bound lytic murein transglycosylase F
MLKYALPLVLSMAWLMPLPAAEKKPSSKLPPVHSGKWTHRYDSHFRKWSKRHFGPNFDWRWFKAQAIVESGLKPHVKGPTGSRGVMQIQPVTFRMIKREIKEDHPRLLDINDPQSNIVAGIYYNRLMFDQWADRYPLINRLSFMLASYNAGYGGVLEAVERAKRAGKSGKRWEDVARYVPKITRHYVSLIKQVMGAGASASAVEYDDSGEPEDDAAITAQGLLSSARAQHHTSTLSTPALMSASVSSCTVCPVVITSSTIATRAASGPSTRNAPLTLRRRSRADS